MLDTLSFLHMTLDQNSIYLFFAMNPGSRRDIRKGSIAIGFRVACRGSFIVLQAMLVVVSMGVGWGYALC